MGKPKFGCPFCSACTPYLSDGDLYCLGDLIQLNQVREAFKIVIHSLVFYQTSKAEVYFFHFV